MKISTTSILLCFFVLSLLSLCERSCAFVPAAQKQQPHDTNKRRDRTARQQIEDSEKHRAKAKHQTKKSRQEEYEHRRQLWMDRYGTLEALQTTFGTGNSTKSGFFRGDLTPEQTRQLYHTLLPRSLLGLSEFKVMKPEELAPLAYNARIAAKEYARSRCVWYARVGTTLFDQYRNVRDKGTLRFGSKSSSMTWEEIWSKYEAQIVQEACEEELDEDGKDSDKKKQKRFNEEDLTMRIYLRILEKSCATNQAFDQMFLHSNKNSSQNKQHENDNMNALAQMGAQLEQDVRELLLPPKESAKVEKKIVKLAEKQLKEKLKEEFEQEKQVLKEQKRQLKEEKKRKKEAAKQNKKEMEALADAMDQSHVENNAEESVEVVPTDVLSHKEHRVLTSARQRKRWRVLKVLAGTRQKFRRLQDTTSSSAAPS